MTHNHDHTHNSGHTHSHPHNHGDGSSHNHNQQQNSTADELTTEQKLERLLNHWIAHNESHKETFITWAERAGNDSLDQIALKLEKAGQLSGEITLQLEDALKKLKNSKE